MSRHEEGRRTKQQRDEHSELFSPPNDKDARPLACLRDNFKRATIRQSNKGISHVGFIHGRKLARYWGERLSRHPRKYAQGTEILGQEVRGSCSGRRARSPTSKSINACPCSSVNPVV